MAGWRILRLGSFPAYPFNSFRSLLGIADGVEAPT